jgi:Ca2+-binding RTX toxin-like protein
LDSTDNYLQLGDKNNVVGYDASETENYADMRGYDTIIGGSEKDLIIDYPGADSLMGGAGSDFIFTPDYDLQQYDGTDTVNGGKGNDLLWIDDGDNATCGTGSDAFVIEANSKIRFDEPSEQDANPDRVTMTYDSRADETNVYADGKKVAEIFGVYPNELQDFYLGNFSRIA